MEKDKDNKENQQEKDAQFESVIKQLLNTPPQPKKQDTKKKKSAKNK